jgi:hypothetical protein
MMHKAERKVPHNGCSRSSFLTLCPFAFSDNVPHTYPTLTLSGAKEPTQASRTPGTSPLACGRKALRQGLISLSEKVAT